MTKPRQRAKIQKTKASRKSRDLISGREALREFSWKGPSITALGPGGRAVSLSSLDAFRMYEGAARTKRTKGWHTENSSANTESLISLPTLRSRMRDLVRNNGYAGKAVTALTSNSVGCGIIAKTIAKNEKQKSQLDSMWANWAETTECDADGMHDIYGLQALAARCVMESGEVLIRRRWRRASDGLTIPVQFQVLEPDFIDSFRNMVLENGNVVVQGIELDQLGRRVNYYLYPKHPGERNFTNFEYSKPVPADDIIHLYFIERPGQLRGIPRGSSVVIKSRDFDDVLDARIMREKIASCFTVFITAGDTDDLESNEDNENDLPEKVSPGSIWKLNKGQDVEFASPPSPDGFAEFAKVSLRTVSSGFQVPYELLTGDYADASFSSSRMSWLSFDRDIEMMRWLTFVPRLCKGTYRWFLDGATAMGVNVAGVSSAWTPPRREMIDPVAETRALGIAVRLGLMDLREAIRTTGNDPDQVLKDIAETKKILDQFGLVLDSDPSKTTQAGMLQGSDTFGGDSNATSSKN